MSEAAIVFKRFCSLGIDDRYWRLIVWWGCVFVSVVCTILWWPLGLLPFVVLLVCAIRATRR